MLQKSFSPPFARTRAVTNSTGPESPQTARPRDIIFVADIDTCGGAVRLGSGGGGEESGKVAETGNRSEAGALGFSLSMARPELSSLRQREYPRERSFR